MPPRYRRPTAALTDIGAGLQGPAGLVATALRDRARPCLGVLVRPGGRLWAATAGYEDDGTDAVYLVPSTGAAPTRVIADLHTPLGLVWVGDTLYVASKGRVDAYSGFEGTAFASHRTILTLPDGVGEVNGLARSPDGRFVLGVSAPCDACTPTSPYAAAVVSFLPDGTDLRVEASGIRAPVGLAYVPGTADLLVTMNQRDDLGTATPGDWLSIVRSGQAWGFPACYGQGGERVRWRPAARRRRSMPTPPPAASRSSRTFGSLPGSSAIVAEWAKGVVLRVALTAQGDTYRGTAVPFLTGLTNPVPVATAPDGTLLVGDWGTGTVYRVAPA